eukprot:COSAG04_NODE_7037_length_1204_cov_363.071493_2_plen_59_part_00
MGAGSGSRRQMGGSGQMGPGSSGELRGAAAQGARQGAENEWDVAHSAACLLERSYAPD